MDFFTTETNGLWLLEPEHEIMVRRVDDKMFIFHVLNNSDYTKELIKVALASSSNTREVEQRLADLTKLERFTFLVISNEHKSYRDNPVQQIPNTDPYIRFSMISMGYYTKGKFTGVSAERSFMLKDENTKAVLARLPVISDDVMDALRSAGVIRNFNYVEYPWVNNFKFHQPAGTTPPADFHHKR